MSGFGARQELFINNPFAPHPDLRLASNYVKEVDGLTTTIRKTYNAGSTSIAVRTIVNDTQNTLNWLLSDHLGSASITTTADGTWFSELRYSAFGETRYSSGITATDYRYTGQLQQADINLYYYNARYYDPALGRFVQSDTIVPQPYSVQGYDRYAYVNNNPLRYTDPSGHGADGGIGDPKCGPGSYRCKTIWDPPVWKKNPLYKNEPINNIAIASGTYGKDADPNEPGPLPEDQVHFWIKDAKGRTINVFTEQYVGTLYDKNDPTRVEIFAKYRQMLNIAALSLDGNTAVIGYSGGADSALIYAENHPIAALVLIDPTFSGRMNHDGSRQLFDFTGYAMINDLAERGVKVVVVDDGGNMDTGEMFKKEGTFHENIYFVPYGENGSRPHYTDQYADRSGSNTNPALIENSWNFINTGAR